MSGWAKVVEGVVEQLDQRKALVVNNVQYTLDVYALALAGEAGWSLAELEKLGVYRIVEPEHPAGKTPTTSSLRFTGTAVERVYEYVDTVVPKVSVDDVATERKRRLALGFDYDFADARGVHRIGTTDTDLNGWDEVSQIAQVAINLGQPATEIQIVTDTGPVAVTATEWQSVLLAAGAHRQPLWAASFALQATDPIPADFENDKYWPASSPGPG